MSEAKAAPARIRRAPARKRKAKIVRESWSADKRATFLATLAATCNVSAGVRSITMSESSVYRLRRKSPEFRAEWQGALREGYARLELAMLERAINGTEKPVFHLGKEVGRVREYPDRTAMTLLSAHRGTVMGDDDGPKPSHPEEVRRRILDKLAEMNARLLPDE